MVKADCGRWDVLDDDLNINNNNSKKSRRRRIQVDDSSSWTQVGQLVWLITEKRRRRQVLMLKMDYSGWEGRVLGRK